MEFCDLRGVGSLLDQPDRLLTIEVRQNGNARSVKGAISRARRRGRFGLLQRRLTIIGLTTIAIGATYLLTVDRDIEYQHMIAGVVGILGLIILVIDWFVTRDVRRKGGVQAMRSGGALSTGPQAQAGRLWAQGEGFRVAGLPADARKNFSEAASLFKSEKDLEGQAITLLSQGRLETDAGQFDRAGQFLREAQKIFEEAKNYRGLGDSFLLQARLATRQRQDSAREMFQSAAAAYRDSNDRFGEANALLGYGDVVSRLTLIEEAGGAYDQARFLFSTTGDRLGESFALYCRAAIDRKGRDTGQAQSRLERSLVLARRCGDLVQEGHSRIALADIMRKLSRVNDAKTMALEGAKRYTLAARRVGNNDLIAGRGDLTRNLYRYDLARADCSIARGLFTDNNDKLDEAKLLVGIGQMERLAGNFGEAKTQFDRAKLSGTKENDLLVQADSTKGLGQTEMAKNQKWQAKNLLREAYGYYQNFGGGQNAAHALMDIGQLDVLMEQPDKARIDFMQARGMFQTMQDVNGEATAVRAIAELDMALGRVQQAQSSFAEARNLFRQVGRHLEEADATFMIGVLAINFDNATATTLLVQAAKLYKAVGAIEWQRRALNMAKRTR